MGASNSNSGGKPKAFYSIYAKADAENNPAFRKSEKDSSTGKWVRTTSFTEMSGMISGARIKEKEYQGSKKKIFVLDFEDENEVSSVEFGHSGLAYSIINTLSANIDTISNFKIRLYKTESKTKAGSFFANAYIEKEGQKCNWAFNPNDESVPKKEVIVNKKGDPILKDGQEQYDDAEVRAFYESLFSMSIVSKFAIKESSRPVSQPVSEMSDDDLPF